jgi:uncharacterized membrane protein YeiH
MNELVTVSDLVTVLDYVGVAVFATSGALKASEKEMDIVGFILTATVTGIGGGTLRDLLLGLTPVFWVTNNHYLVICIVVAIVTFFVAQQLARRDRWLAWADAVGLATFCIGGASLAIAAGASMLVAVVMGVMTACFGGVIRDVLCGEIPMILRREIYATAAAVGALTYVALQVLPGWEWYAAAAGFAVALAARGAGILWKLSLPVYKAKP